MQVLKSKFNMDNAFQAVPYNGIVLEKGDGNWVYDTDGNKYLDLNSGQFCLSFGHNDKGLQDVVLNQMRKIYHTNTSTLTPEFFQACNDIASITGGNLTKTMFLSTGSEANECAFRYSRFITGKNSIIALKKGYHGLTLGSQELTMGGLWARPQIPQDSLHDCYIDDFSPNNVRSQIEKIEKEHSNDIAAVIVEPILGVGGVLIPSNDFFVELRNICTEKNIILIFDECQTGFGRTGNWFAYQKIGVEPDVLVCAKAMGLGFAVSSVTFNKDLAAEIEGKIVHFSSHQNDPLSCAIVSYVIKTIKGNNLLEHNKEMGEYLLSSLKQLSNKYKLIENPRGLGLMLGFDLPTAEMQRNPNLSSQFLRNLEKEGVLLQAIQKGKTFRLSPSYIINKTEIDFLISKITKVLDRIK